MLISGGHDDNPLLFEPTAEQQTLLDVVWDGAVRTGGTWPVWDYVERTLEARSTLMASEVLSSLPVIGLGTTSSSYAPIQWANRAGMWTPRPDSIIVLSVAGLRHIQDLAAEEVMQTASIILGEAAYRHAHITPDPLAPVGGHLTKVNSIGFARNPGLQGLVLSVLGCEPAVSGAMSGTGGQVSVDDWKIELFPHLRYYRNVASPEDYLNRVLLHSGWTPTRFPNWYTDPSRTATGNPVAPRLGLESSV